jgi:hypothetical protein
MAAGIGATASQVALLTGPPADRLERALARGFTPASQAVIDVTCPRSDRCSSLDHMIR